MADEFEIAVVCDSNSQEAALGVGRYELIAGIGLKRELNGGINELYRELDSKGTWKFGLFEYPDKDLSVSKAFFFEPLLVVYIKKSSDEIVLENTGMDDVLFNDVANRILSSSFSHNIDAVNLNEFRFIPSTDRNEYLQKVEQIRHDILYGKYYEMNYCIEFKAEMDELDFLPYAMRLNERTAAPFAAYVKLPNHTILCSSPERFLFKSGKKLISQPIKGTNRRLDSMENVTQLAALKTNEKEIAENVMIVDLVRNDLAEVCKTGSIRVDELFGAYPFKTVNHLISTISGEISGEIDLEDILKALFPMGSMTGAPKLEVMKHINLYENHNRGIYSGALGYIDPEGDFDFNVLIRSLVYSKLNKTISYKVGSAITYDSEPEFEYEECLLKGHRLEDLFRN